MDNSLLSGVLDQLGAVIDPLRPRGNRKALLAGIDTVPRLSVGAAPIDTSADVARAAVLLAQGAPREALVLIDGAFDANPDPIMLTRMIGLRLLILHHLCARTPGNGHIGDAGSEWTGLEFPAEFERRQLQLQQRTAAAPAAVSIETVLHGDVLATGMMLTAGEFVAAALVEHHHSGRLLNYLDQSVTNLAGLLQLAVDKGPDWQMHLRLGLGHLHCVAQLRRGDNAGALATLAWCRKEAEAFGDPAGVVHALLGELTVETCRLGNPLTLDLLTSDTGFASSERRPDVARLQNNPRPLSALASRLSVEATERAKEIDCPSLQALTALFAGHLSHVGGDREAHLMAAMTAQQAAEADDDRALAALAQCHQILASLPMKRSHELEDDAARLATAAGTTAGAAHALGLGHMMAAYGRRLSASGELTEARLAHRCARSYFEALGASVHAAQQDVDLADLDGTAGRLHQQFSGYLTAVGKLEKLANPDAHHRLVDLAQRVASTAAAIPDPVWIEHAQVVLARARELLANVDPGPGESTQATWEVAIDSLRWLSGQLAVNRSLAEADRAEVEGRHADAEHSWNDALHAAWACGDGGFMAAVVLTRRRRFDEAMEVLDQQGGSSDLTPALDVLNRHFGTAGQQLINQQDTDRFRLKLDLAVQARQFQQAHRYLAQINQALGPEWWATDERPYETELLLGQMAEADGDWAEAANRYTRAIDGFDHELRAASEPGLRGAAPVGSKAERAYLSAARLQVKLNNHGEALRLFEAGKARQLRDQLEMNDWPVSPDLRIRAHRIRSLVAELDALRAARLVGQASVGAADTIEALDRRIAAVTAELDDAEGQTVLGEIAGLDAGRPVAPDQLASRLPANVAAITWCVVGDELVTWSILPSGAIEGVVSSIDSSAFRRSLTAMAHAAVDGGTLESITSRSGDLSTLLLEPHRAALEQSEQILFLPFGVGHASPLHLLPFDGVAIGTRWAVSYLPSLAALGEHGGRSLISPAAATVTVVGNPRAMAWRSPWQETPAPQRALPYAEVEASAVASLYQQQPLIGPAADKARVKAALASSQIVHLATHGLLLPEMPAHSAILLADGESLAVYELAGVTAEADLVVLSGCRTSLGSASAGDDMIGLSRSLLASGTSHVVSSLWDVDDLMSCLIMFGFHERLRSDRPPAFALFEASEHVRRLSLDDRIDVFLELESSLRAAGSRPPQADTERSAPRYWAPFVVHGI